MDTIELASISDIEEFLHCALVSWMELYTQKRGLLSDYPSLLEGIVIHNIWQKVDPDPSHTPSSLSDMNGAELAIGRTRNFDAIVQNVRDFYENELDQIMLTLPDPFTIGFRPETKSGLEHIKLLITFVLGAAVQCSQKEEFIGKMKELDVGTQHAIVELIKQVTESHNLVLSLDNVSTLPRDILHRHFKSLEKERNSYYAKWIAEITSANQMMIPATAFSISDNLITNNCHLADLKSKIRELRQELDEKTESNAEMSMELEHKQTRLEKLQCENQEIYLQAKRAAMLRDELDATRERAEKADRLEAEVEKLREKLATTEFYKTRVEELREDNKVLLDTKQILEDQLERARCRAEQIPILESKLNMCKQKLKGIVAERNIEKTKLEALIEENVQLQMSSRQPLPAKADLNVSDCDVSVAHADISLSEQLKNSVQAKLLALELENTRLLDQIQEVKGSSPCPGHTSQAAKDSQPDHSKVMQRLIEERNSLQSSLGEAQKKLKDLAQQNKIQAGKIIFLKSKIEELAFSDRKAHELQKHVEKLAEQQTANESHINNLKKNLNLKCQTIDIIKNNLVELGFDANSFENAQKSLQPEKVFRSAEMCSKFLKLFNKSVATDGNGELASKVTSLETKLQTMENVNSQLAANKEKLLTEINTLKEHHELIEEDRSRLRKQKDKLSYERYNILKDHDILKTLIREIQEENKDLKIRATRLNRATIEELAVLRSEHAKLTEDYSSLFATCQEYKSTYETLRAEYEAVETENERLRGQINELAERIDHIVNSETGYGTLLERLRLLKDHNESLVDDRRQLMAHNSTLLTEYRNLLNYSRQDRRDFGEAEQAYLDKINQLIMQKERLEIKIIDQYKTPDNAAKRKEKGFLTRMKRASCELLGRSSMRNDPSTSTDESCTTPSKMLNDLEPMTPSYEYATSYRMSSSDQADVHSVGGSESVSPKSEHTSTSPRTSTDVQSFDDSEAGVSGFESTSAYPISGKSGRPIETIGVRRGNLFAGADDFVDCDDNDDALSIENFGILEPGYRKPIYMNEEEKTYE